MNKLVLAKLGVAILFASIISIAFSRYKSLLSVQYLIIGLELLLYGFMLSICLYGDRWKNEEPYKI